MPVTKIDVCSQLAGIVSVNRHLFDSMLSAIVILDAQGYIVYSNAAFEKLSGSDSINPGMNRFSDVMPKIRGLDAAIDECLQLGSPGLLHKTFRPDLSEDHLLPFAISTNPLGDSIGVVVNIEVDTEVLRKYYNDEKIAFSARIKELTASLSEKTGVIRSLFDNSPVGMMIYNQNGEIIKINDTGLSIFEVNKASSVGKSIYEFYDKEEFDSNIDYFQPSNLSIVSFLGNEKKLLRCSVKSEIDESFFIETFMDVTEMEQARLEIEKAKIAAEASNAAKTEFLANMSHELRTPMHGIIGFAQLGIIEGMSLSSDKVTDYFEKIYEVGNQLLRLQNDLIDLAKMESDQLNPNYIAVDIHRIVEIVMGENQALLDIKTMSAVLENNLVNSQVIADEGLIRQVLRNVMLNAINYSPASSRIDIKLDNEPGCVKIQVVDQGPGIPESEKEAIFEKFIQSSYTKDGSGGSGLGLAICKRIVVAHKGDIWVENNESGGARFFITLPQ